MNRFDAVLLRLGLLWQTFQSWRSAPPAPRPCQVCGGQCVELSLRVGTPRP